MPARSGTSFSAPFQEPDFLSMIMSAFSFANEARAADAADLTLSLWR